MQEGVISALKTVAPYAGVAGMSIVVFYYLFREFIRKNVFPQLTKEQAYRLFAVFLSLVFLLTISGILIWASHDLGETYRLMTIIIVTIFLLSVAGGFAWVYSNLEMPNRRKGTSTGKQSESKRVSVQDVNTVISIEQLHGGSIYTGHHYVTHSEKTSLDLQIGGVVDDKMRFSIVSSGKGKFIVDRICVKLHGFADCPLRDEVSLPAAFMATPAYVFHLSPEFSEYDLIPLDSPGVCGAWRYIGEDFDEFLVRFVFRPYTLFVFSVQVEARDLKSNKPILLSSEFYEVIEVVQGNYGGCLDLGRWYTPELLKQPKQRAYKGSLDTLVYQLMICDLERNSSYLGSIGHSALKRVLPAIETAVSWQQHNPVFRGNREKIQEFLSEQTVGEAIEDRANNACQ